MSHLCPYLLCTTEGHRIPGASGEIGDIATQEVRGKKMGTNIFRGLTMHWAEL